MRGLAATLGVCLLLAGPRPAVAGGEADRWLDGLQDRVAEDLAAGAPLVVQVHVPLCDNRILRCGNRKLGDGDNPATNLYWATSGGFVGWFQRKGSGWRQVLRWTAAAADTGAASGTGARDLLEIRVWKRRFGAARGWRRRGVKSRFDVYVVAYAWRGTAIDRALEAFVADAMGDAERSIELPDGTRLQAGGAARLVAYVGHNRWMDLPEYDWVAAAERHPGRRIRGVIAVACHTAAYLAEPLSSERRVPLLMTRDFLFAGAHSFEGAVAAFARSESLAGIRASAAEAYADGEDKSVKRVRGAFTNPSDRRWGK